ncbi:hypothetical protein EDC04DRAFT_2907011 [Pisolithus marmoratus]|nr:hypothetical protein EDC04DRAFT_2907011 [Pisolithus marmoratus]
MSATPVSSSECMLEAHKRLMNSGLYLGDPSIAVDLQWVHDGCEDVLVHVPHGTSPNGSQQCSPVNNDAPQPAVLCAIVHIDRNDFWLMADGGYVGLNAIWKEILDMKPSCALHEPGFSSGKSFFSTDIHGLSHFKLCHRLFETINAAIDGDDVPMAAPPATDPFSFELWPLTKERNHGELLALKSTHHILPLPAYDMLGDLIKPSAYRCSLQGAIIEIHFTLSHWAIASTKHDVYGGFIHLIHLLMPLLSYTACKKCKLPLHLDTVDSPPDKRASLSAA